MPVDEIELEAEEKMESAGDYLRQELRGLRTGRASAALVEYIKVEYYGAPTDLRQLAAINTPEASLIIIKPFDPGSVKDIEKAIQASNLGITPQSDGKIIRLAVPPLSGERRKILMGQVKQMGEQAKVAVRNARREGNHELEREQKDKSITEDERDSGKQSIQKLTDQYVAKIDEIIGAKNKEVEEI